MNHFLFCSVAFIIINIFNFTKDEHWSVKNESHYLINTNKVTEIFVSADSPCYISPQTITIKHDYKTRAITFIHSGLVVQGQGPNAIYTISKPCQKNLSKAKFDTIMKLLNDDNKWYTKEQGIYNSGCIYTISIIWLDNTGTVVNKKVNSYDFINNDPPPLFYEIIATVSMLCIGSDMVEASHIKYD